MATIPHIRRKIVQNAHWWYGNFRSQLGRPIRWPNQAGAVLVYHGLTEGPPRRINARFIDLARFESDLQYIAEHLHPVSLSNYAQGIRHPERCTVAISFDVGYRNNLLALPLLEKYQIPATFFITASQSKGHDLLWNDLLDLVQAT